MKPPRSPYGLAASVRKAGFLALPLYCLVGILAGMPGHGQNGPGDLLVAPTRIVLEGRQRTAEVTLVNTGHSTATYRITFINLRMNEMGGMTEIEAADAAPDERFADRLIRYSPRQVTLEPKVAQTVRMQLRLPADLPPGEYRSHLRFRAVPTAEASAIDKPAAQFGVRLVPIYGISIPIIVRHGGTAATATLSDLVLAPPTGAETAPTLHFQMHREGNRSVFGNLTVTFVPASGKPTVVGIANGIAVYTPNRVRAASISLRAPPGLVLKKGRLHLAFTLQKKENETIAEADLPVP